MEENKRKTKTLPLVAAEVEVETSAKELPFAWTSPLLKKKPLANEEATVSAALTIEKSHPLIVQVRLLIIH